MSADEGQAASGATSEVALVLHAAGGSRGSTLVLIAAGGQPRQDGEADFLSFAESDELVPFMRGALHAVEANLGLASYHLRVVPWDREAGGPGGRRDGQLLEVLTSDGAQPVCQAAAARGFFVFVAGNNAREGHVPALPGLDDLDAPIMYQDASGNRVEVPGLTVRSVLVRGDEPESLVRCNLDFQGRPCYVVVMAPAAPAAAAARARGDVVRRQSELSHEELSALWRIAASVASMHGGFQDMRLNAGTFQNLAHLHLKVFIDEWSFGSVWGDQEVFQQLRASWKPTVEPSQDGKAQAANDVATDA